MRNDHPSSSTPRALQYILIFALSMLVPLRARAQSSPLANNGPAALNVDNPQVNSSRTPPQVVSGEAQLIGPYTASPKLRLVLALQPPHMEEEQQFLAALQDKKSPLYHQFLTPQEWASRFAPSEQDEQAVVDWATSSGLTISQRYPSRLIVDVEGPIAMIEKAVNVSINSYSLNGKSYYSNDRDPEIPANLANILISVQGLNNIQRMTSRSSSTSNVPEQDYFPGPVSTVGTSGHATGSLEALEAAMAAKAKQVQAKGGSVNPHITNGNYDPTDIYNSNAYDFAALRNLGHCCNPTGTSGGTPPTTSIAIADYGDFAASDIQGFQNQYPYLAYRYTPIHVIGTPPCCQQEATADVEWALATSNSFGSENDTAQIYIYETATFSNAAFTTLYMQMMTDGKARIMSTSVSCTENTGCDSGVMSSQDNIFSEMAGEGWTLVAASGDRGATDNCTNTSVSFPSSDPNVTGVGGTLLQLSSSSIFESEVGSWNFSTQTGACAGNYGGSGGGCSTVFPAPGYQNPAACGSWRSTPDIALNADFAQNIYFNGALGPFYGTSMSAPMVAGFMAQENAYLLALGDICGLGTNACAPLGAANTDIYYEGNDLSAPHIPLYDILKGCNDNDITQSHTPPLKYYCAGPGYDDVTGWGSFNALQMAWMFNWFSAPTEGGPTITFGGPTVGKWYNTDQLVDWDVTDTSTNGYTPTGVSGFSEAWDSDPGDVSTEKTPGQGNSFYSGPQIANKTFGCIDMTGALCTGASVGQGWHTVNVRAWNNMGVGSGDYTYGPIGYDTIPPVTTDRLTGTLSGSLYENKVTVTLTASDPSPGSGVASTVYQVNGGTVTTYTAPFAVTSEGANTVTFHSTDNAGNVESTKSVGFSITSGTTTKLTSSLNPAAAGKSVTFTATVSPTIAGTPTGTVTFKNGATVLGTATLSSGKATHSTSTLAVGSDSITATYNGATYFLASMSSTLTEKIEATTKTALASSLNPAKYGQTVVFTATITHSGTGTPTGSVAFKNGSVLLGTGTLTSAGKATFSTATLKVSTGASITAVYSGDSNFAGSTSPAVVQVVNKASTSTKVVSSLNPSTSGTKVTFTATVKSSTTGTPTGSVSFYDGTTKLGTASLSGGVAGYSTSTLSVATHNITAIYAGNSDYATSTSPVLKQTVKE
jgi:hypothetical protein